LAGEDRRRFWDHLFTNTIFKDATPPERKKFLYTTRGYAQTFILQKNTIMSMVNYDGNPFSPDHNQIFKRFSYSFEQSYVRFLDLVKAEAQAREAQIEASLERVRSKAMAMHSSRDLAETIKTIYQQIETLSVIPRRLGIGIINKDAHSVELTTMNSTDQGDSVEIVGTLSLTGHSVLEGIYDNWLTQTEYRPVLTGNELRDYYKIVRPQIAYPDYPTTYTQYGYFFYFPEGGLYAWTEQEMSSDELQLYRRFSSVLSLTYKRYIDLKEAEAQARESSIQLALERVRARTMAMQRSDELVETSQLLFEEFNKLHLVSLGEYPDRAFIGIPDKSHTKVDFWSTDLSGTGINYKFEGNIKEPHLFNRTIQAWKNGEKSIIIDLDGKELASYLDYLKSIGFPVAESHYQRRRIHYFAFFSKGLVGISTAHRLPPETLPLLERFAGVFDLTYTRFLDLQKAEAQVRESKIELALERVRARTMAMQRSDELAEAAEVLFKQFAELGNEPDRISIGIIDESGGFTDLWATDQQGRQLKILFKARNSEKTTFKKMVAAWKAGKKSMIIDLRDDDLKEWIGYIRNEMGLTIRDEHFNNRRIHQVSFFSQGWLNITTLEPLTDDVLSLLDRFAAVFNLTFTRFLDLKKAEAQTRQAQIETAMEKVRARSLAMQKPEELKEVAQVLRSEMGVLGVEELEGSTIFIHAEGSEKADCWFAIKDENHSGKPIFADYILLQLNATWVGRAMLAFFNSPDKQISIPMIGQHRREWIEYCYQHSPLFDGYYGENIPDRIYHLFKFSNGAIGAAAPAAISEESWELLKRATTVFSLAYTRFNDLQRSEANTREAVKQASMDRVRAEIASMRAPADLEKIIPLLWRELTVLGVPFIRCGVFIMDDPIKQIHTYLSTPEGKALAAFDIPYATPGNITQLLNHWRDKKAYLDHWDEEDFKEFAANLVRLGAMSSQEQYLSTLPPGGFRLHFLPFLQGMLYVGNLTELPADELNLVQSVADAFSTAYARYEDFNKLEAAKLQVDQALVDLKQAQQQLVQSEKMASLGELTAGIAHEIQNPLNFVNNFSEVNSELIDEIKQALQSGHIEDVLSLAENVRQNLEKINFHGKRADGIVKSMLQHTRSMDPSGKNKKEPTDINALTDEYLRLAYHGLRAKDKTFNANLNTDFDESVGLIEVVSQDIARAILNLITNAFYAVQEKQKKMEAAGETFSPMVSIFTKRLTNTIEIRIKDNGPGIPDHILDKIFQPFFTTKPTGQGTGLGLSLCYDIVKAHGGELKVVTELGVGSEFIIILPIV
jgi:signal transduction histidine kinase